MWGKFGRDFTPGFEVHLLEDRLRNEDLRLFTTEEKILEPFEASRLNGEDPFVLQKL